MGSFDPTHIIQPRAGAALAHDDALNAGEEARND